MAKLTLSTLTSSYRSNTALNANFDAIEAAIENTLSRDGTSPNAMSASLDMGSQLVINQLDPVSAQDGATKNYVDDVIATGTANAAASAASAAAALVSENAASSSASAASTSASNAATSETNAAASYDAFDDRYLGSKASDPALDNDGDPLLDGAIYWNSTDSYLYVYDLGSTAWVSVITSTSTDTLTNKTHTSPAFNGTPTFTADSDRDNFLDAVSPSRRVNVKDDFGATGDGVRGTDGVAVASDATFTSAAAPFVSSDVGKLITVNGAGTAGADLSTTIASFNSSSSVELTVAPTTNVASGGIFTFGTDDHAALQAALDANTISEVPAGLYCISDELVLGVVQRGSGLIGTVRPSEYYYTTQSGGPTWGGDQEPTIVYCGAPTTAASPKSVLRVSSAATGTMPAQTYDGITFAGPIDQINFDANSRAYVGLYVARVNGVDIGHVYCRGAVGHGFLMAHCFSGTVKHVYAWQNLGCGITLGGFETTDGTTQTWPLDWTTSQINAMRFGYLQASANGQDGAFDDATNERWGYGVGIFTHRANMFDTILSENNDGAGLFFGPTGGANTIDTLYTELNSALVRKDTHGVAISSSSAIDEARADDGYSIWFEGAAGGASQHAEINNVFAYTSKIKMTGTEPGRFPEGAFTIHNVSNGDDIEADWDNYRIENISQDAALVITGHLPAANDVDSLAQTTPVTTFYVRSGGSDSNDGRTSGNAFLTVQKAVDMAVICTDVTTIDCASTTLTNVTIDLQHMKRDLTLTGGTLNQSGSGAYALDIAGGRGQCVLTLTSLTQLQAMRIQNATVILSSVTTHVSGHSAAAASYLLWLDKKAELRIDANVQADANAARGVRLQGGSDFDISTSWRIDNTTLVSNAGVHAFSGGGTIRTNLTFGSSNSDWANNFAASGSAAGFVQFADETIGFNKAFGHPYSDGTTGGASSAGSGNQYVELQIGGTTYKVLHDGTV